MGLQMDLHQFPMKYQKTVVGGIVTKHKTIQIPALSAPTFPEMSGTL